MSYENWKDKAQGFQTMDVRHIQGSFFEGLKKRAEALEMGEGLHIIQTFEPHPLYAVMEGLEAGRLPLRSLQAAGSFELSHDR